MNINQTINENELVIPIVSAPGIHLTETTLKENLVDADTQFATLATLVGKFQPDGIFPFMDLTVEVEALGLDIEFPANENPSVIEHPVKTEEDLEKIKKEWNGITGRMETFIEVAEKMAANFSIMNGAYVIGPYTMAGELIGVNKIATDSILNPGFVHEVIEFSNKVISEYANALFDAGIDTIMVLEPTAVILSPELYREFSLQPFQELVANVDNQPLMLHICGDTTHLIEPMLESNAVAFSLDSDVDFAELKNKVPEDIALIGNLDPTSLFLQSTPEQVAQETRKLKGEMRDVDNFVLSTGCDLPLETPHANITAFMEAAREVRREKKAM